MPRLIRESTVDLGSASCWASVWVLALSLSVGCYPNPDDLRGAQVTTGTCPDPEFPQHCPALNDAPAGCVTAETVCSTVVICGDQQFACRSASLIADCVASSCVSPSLCPIPSGGTPFEKCSAHKCCSLWGECRADGTCYTTESGPIWDELLYCSVAYCGELASSSERP